MDDREFLDRLKSKIERLADCEIDLQMDTDNQSKLAVDLLASLPRVTVGSNLLHYPGFARMAVEYAVESIRQGREIPPLEFQFLLSRN